MAATSTVDAIARSAMADTMVDTATADAATVNSTVDALGRTSTESLPKFYLPKFYPKPVPPTVVMPQPAPRLGRRRKEPFVTRELPWSSLGGTGSGGGGARAGAGGGGRCGCAAATDIQMTEDVSAPPPMRTRSRQPASPSARARYRQHSREYDLGSWSSSTSSRDPSSERLSRPPLLKPLPPTEASRGQRRARPFATRELPWSVLGQPFGMDETQRGEIESEAEPGGDLSLR